jgi:hypothetical protein
MVPAFQAERFAAGVGDLGHPQSVESEQRNEGVLAGRAEPSCDQ